jgi:hypothetical protein
VVGWAGALTVLRTFCHVGRRDRDLAKLELVLDHEAGVSQRDPAVLARAELPRQGAPRQELVTDELALGEHDIVPDAGDAACELLADGFDASNLRC